MFRVERHVIPVVPLSGVRGFVRVTLLVFLANERPRLVERDLTGLRGKSPEVVVDLSGVLTGGRLKAGSPVIKYLPHSPGRVVVAVQAADYRRKPLL